jgi:serine phosphatase RsbU (regulator of sigma subunit)
VQELDRLEALRLSGLSAAPDPDMDRFAALVCRLLDVPVALVTLVEADRQVFPGVAGLEDDRRETPLSHSFCRHVVATGEPLIIKDARRSTRPDAQPPANGLGIVAYAGMPLTDQEGNVLGSLCAIDRRPRSWTRTQLADLADLAAACAAELRLRIVSERIRHAQRRSEQSHILAEEASEAARRAWHQARLGREHAELLLRASQDMARCSTVQDVRLRLRHLFNIDGGPSYVGLLLVDEHGLRRIPDPEHVHQVERELAHVPAQAPFPSATALARRRPVLVRDRAAMKRYAPQAAAAAEAMGLSTVWCLPLEGSRRPVGVLVLGWRTPHDIAVTERAALTAVGGYVAQALDRAVYIDQRTSAARQLQAALLTELPALPGLEIAALYRPAAEGEMVGGDWYDAYLLPPVEPGRRSPVALTVGDIIGHDIHAAALMGQVRSMLRQATLDHPYDGPSAVLGALDHACAILPVDTGGTLVHARLDQDHRGEWQLTWSNAGHPPVLLLDPRHGVRTLDGHDMMFCPGLESPKRTDHQHPLPDGSVLLLHTDGLTERRGGSLDGATATVAARLHAAADLPLPELLQSIAAGVHDSPAEDDIVLLAVRILPRPGSAASR